MKITVLYNKKLPKSPDDFYKYGEPLKYTVLGLIGKYGRHPNGSRLSSLKEYMGFREIKISDDELVRTLDLMVGERLVSRSKINGDEKYNLTSSGDLELSYMKTLHYSL